MASDTVNVTMLVVSGQGPDSQWFDLRPSFYSDVIRVEWDKDTMDVELPRDTADLLIRSGYARERQPPDEAPQKEKVRKGKPEGSSHKEKSNDPG